MTLLKKLTTITFITAALFMLAHGFGLADMIRGTNHWLPVQANPANGFVNLHVTNDLEQDILLSVQGFEIKDGESWQEIPLHPQADPQFFIENQSLGTSDETQTLSTALHFSHYLHPDYSRQGTFRIAVRIKDTAGNLLERRHSNEFELN
jgi:hypothetical protein